MTWNREWGTYSDDGEREEPEWNGAFIKLPIKATNMRKNINNILSSANWIHCTSEFKAVCWWVGFFFRGSVKVSERRVYLRKERCSGSKGFFLSLF